jgi:hypothetical protein
MRVESQAEALRVVAACFEQACITSPCSRRAAARPGTRRGWDGPRPAAEGQLVRLLSWAVSEAAS